jgi:hypothetical protein
MSVEYEAWRILCMISVGVSIMPHGVISRVKVLCNLLLDACWYMRIVRTRCM